MNTPVAVVGANGRVGAAIRDHLAGTFEVVPIVRRPGESAAQLARRAASAAEVLVNAAGVAHLERPGVADVDRLHEGNVTLPMALADAALARGISFVHVSSVKAGTDDSTPYAASKREAEQRLEQLYGDRFASSGLSLIAVRPLALLFPPFDAGKLQRLRFLGRWPSALTPPIPLPVLAPSTFLAAITAAVEGAVAGRTTTGFTRREFGRSERGTLRDVRDAMLHGHGGAAR